MSTELATQTPTQQLLDRIGSPEFKQELELAMPPGVSVDRFVRVTKTAILQTPELVTTDRASLFTAIARCAQDGLLPDGRKAALVIFSGKDGKKAQYLPMIGGLRDIAAEHGFSLEAHVVYQQDDFEWELGFEPTVTHKPPMLNEERGEAIGAYAVATQLATGQKFLEVMSRGEIEQVRKVSRASDSQYGPWVNWWGEMARKTVARRLFKQLPLGDLDERQEAIVKQADIDVDLPAVTGDAMSVDEANIAAPLANVTPPPDQGPDDGQPATPEQHGQLLELIVKLADAKPDTDWQQASVDYATAEHGCAVIELTGVQMGGLLAHLEAQR